MLITRWPRKRSLAFRALVLSDQQSRRLYHSTASWRSSLNSTDQIIPSIYVDTVPPTAEQLNASNLFFKTHLPTKSWTATEWRQQPHSESQYLIPEIAFLGRSNSGKSSLLNGILSDNKLCRVGAKPGKTTTMHAWSLSPIDPERRGARKGYQGDTESKLTLLDMPGYGHGSHGDWGTAIMKYLTSRRQLRRAFVLVNPVHGLKQQDLQMIELLRGHGISHQLIACKADKMKNSEALGLLYDLQNQIDSHFKLRRQIPIFMTIKDILTVGGLEQTKDSAGWTDSAQGLQDVRWAILRAAGLEEYALTLAANGGKPPKIKPTLMERSTPNHHSASSPTNSSFQMRPDTHPAHLSGESSTQIHVQQHQNQQQQQQRSTSPQTPFTPQTPPNAGTSISTNIDKLVSETAPRPTHPVSNEPNPVSSGGRVTSGMDDFLAQVMPAKKPPPQRKGEMGKRRQRKRR